MVVGDVYLPPPAGVVVQAVHPALQGDWRERPVHGLLPDQSEGAGGDRGAGVEGGGLGHGARHCLHRLGVLAAWRRGGGLERGLSLHLGLQIKVVVGHICQSRNSCITISYK